MSAGPGPAGEPPGAPATRPRVRERPEDFTVEEVPAYEPSGEGGHTFVWVEKRGLGTEEVARFLAREAGVPPRDVGYAGRKDRWAVTRQWLSVPGLEPAAALRLRREGLEVLEARRHPHKLRTGHLRGNRFELVVRGVTDELAARARAGLQRAAESGFPNRFGAQRFGRDGRNAEAGRALLTGERRARDRREARFLVSALQASVFNEALRRRELALDCVELGDVAVVHASGGLFEVEDPAREAPRARAFEISATGPVFGSRVREPSGPPAAREAAALAACGVPPPERWRPPRGLRLRGARRPLRARADAARLEREADALHLAFRLPAGAYATVLLEELLGPFCEGLGGSPAG